MQYDDEEDDESFEEGEYINVEQNEYVGPFEMKQDVGYHSDYSFINENVSEDESTHN